MNVDSRPFQFRFLRFALVWAVLAISVGGKAETEPTDDVATRIRDAALIQEMAQKVLERLEARVDKVRRPSESAAVSRAISSASYHGVRSYVWIKVTMAAAFHRHSEVALFEAINKFVRFSILYPALIATGHAPLAALLMTVPDAEIAAILYLSLKNWWIERRMTRRLGISPSELDRHGGGLFGVESLRRVTLHSMTGDPENGVIAIERRSPFKREPDQGLDRDRISRGELEAAIDDAVFLRHLHSLALDPLLHDQVLLERVLSDDAAYSRFENRLSKARRTLSTEEQGFLLSLQAAIDRHRIEISEAEAGVPWRQIARGAVFRDWWAQRQAAQRAQRVGVDLWFLRYRYLAAHLAGDATGMQESKVDFERLSRDARQSLAELRIAAAKLRSAGRAASAMTCSSVFGLSLSRQ